MATETSRFNWRTRAKVSSIDITGKQIHTLSDHETDHNAHPGFARKGDGTLVDPKVSQAVATHKGDAMAHSLHYTRRSEVIGGDGCTIDQALQQYEIAKVENLTTTANGTATIPTRHIVTAWLLDKVIHIAASADIEKWWTNLITNVAVTVKKLWTFDGGISTSSAIISSVKDAAALCTDNTGKIVAKTVDTTVSKGSNNLITSGGVEKAIGDSAKAHTHGQIANDGSVTMKSSPGDNDPTNVKWVLDQIQSGGGSNFKDYVLDISTSTAGAVIDFDVGTDTNLNVGMYDLIFRATFGTGKEAVTVDITSPTAEVSSSTMAEDVPVYVPGKSLLLIHEYGLKFRVPRSWMNFYGTFQVGSKLVTMDPDDKTEGVLKLSSYKVVARRIYPKY